MNRKKKQGLHKMEVLVFLTFFGGIFERKAKVFYRMRRYGNRISLTMPEKGREK